MSKINFNDIQPGMILASDVLNKNGGLLLKEGTVLSEKHIRIFKTWGIAEADIVGFDKAKLDEESYAFLSEGEIQTLESDLLKRFPDITSNDIMAEVFRVAKKHRIKEYFK
jgi:hypothetical protein